jgi:hypothetical protein
MVQDLVTAMLDGDGIQTRVNPGDNVEDGLQWEDENGFHVEVLSVKELSHVQRYQTPLNVEGATYVGNVVDSLDTGEIVINTGKGGGVLLDSRKVNFVPVIGDTVKAVFKGAIWNVTQRLREASLER